MPEVYKGTCSARAQVSVLISDTWTVSFCCHKGAQFEPVLKLESLDCPHWLTVTLQSDTSEVETVNRWDNKSQIRLNAELWTNLYQGSKQSANAAEGN